MCAGEEVNRSGEGGGKAMVRPKMGGDNGRVRWT